MKKDRVIRFVVGGVLSLFLLVAHFMAGSSFDVVLYDFLGVMKEVLPIFGIPAFIVGGLAFAFLPSIKHAIYGILAGGVVAILGVIYVIFYEFRDYGEIASEFSNPFHYLFFMPKYFVGGFVLYVISLFIYRKFIQKSISTNKITEQVQQIEEKRTDFREVAFHTSKFFGKDNLIRFLLGGLFASILYFLMSLNLVGSTDSFLQTMWYAFSWNVLSILGLSFFGAGGVIFYLLPNLRKAFHCIVGGFIVSILNFAYLIWDEYSNYGYFEFDNYQFLISQSTIAFVVGFGICFFAIVSKNYINRTSGNALQEKNYVEVSTLNLQQQKDKKYWLRMGLALAVFHSFIFALASVDYYYLKIDKFYRPEVYFGHNFGIEFEAYFELYILDFPILYLVGISVTFLYYLFNPWLPDINFFDSDLGLPYGLLIFGALQWFLVGAIIGWVYGKFKNIIKQNGLTTQKAGVSGLIIGLVLCIIFLLSLLKLPWSGLLSGFCSQYGFGTGQHCSDQFMGIFALIFCLSTLLICFLGGVTYGKIKNRKINSY